MFQLSRIRSVLLGACACVASLHGQVTVHYINVGQAASALVEFQDGAILIDAGGESTSEKPSGDVYRRHLIDYLNQVFAKHPDWNKTIEAIIISHPHKDHTMFLMDVMNNFTVHTLIDNGAECGSGIDDLKKARAFATSKQINYLAVRDKNIHAGGLGVHLLPGESADGPQILLLSGGRNCLNANNDSIAVRVVTKEVSMLFVGDSENEDSAAKSSCPQPQSKCVPELSMLADKYGPAHLLKADLYHVAHHGSYNGSTEEFLKIVSPEIAVISAGEALRAGPGSFHAWEFGHPRDKAVAPIVENTSGLRTSPTEVPIFEAANTATSKNVSPPKKISLDKAVYCTCWDGDIKVEFFAGVKTTPKVTTDGFEPDILKQDSPKKVAKN